VILPTPYLPLLMRWVHGHVLQLFYITAGFEVGNCQPARHKIKYLKKIPSFNFHRQLCSAVYNYSSLLMILTHAAVDSDVLNQVYCIKETVYSEKIMGLNSSSSHIPLYM